MATIRTSRAAGGLARLLTEAAPGVEQTDGELVRAFVERKCPAAFEELVLRHGSMVLGVCLRVLRHRQDAEDAFQATFLVLARKAGSVSPPVAVGNWLHGVALQTAVRARAITVKRQGRVAVVPSVPETATREAGWDDVAGVLDEELGRLPNHYRAVLLLCDVEGRTRAGAARHLGCPEGSVSSRLSRARAMLAERLTKRGVTLPAGAVALLLGRNASTAGVPAALVTVTAAAVGPPAAGSLLPSGVSPAVKTLTAGVLKTMLLKKIMATTTVALVSSVVAIAGGSLAVGQSEGTGKPMAGKGAKQSSSGGITLDPVLSKPATGKLVPEVKAAPAGKQIILTPEEAIKMASDSKLTTDFNESKPAVEFKVQFVTKAILVKAGDKKDAGWVHGHSPDDIYLGLRVPLTPVIAADPLGRDHTRFVATLTAKAIAQLHKAGVDDLEKHFKGR
ncbi:MAG TPA: sigma-70 family RNA polymerase sigma factor, partial [Urbifossiella sp.]|nr:sigma-70 family RNA polymerase sigma factor [Urbifossiella sp.]